MKGIIPWDKGVSRPDMINNTYGKLLKGIKFTKVHKERIMKALQGNTHGFKKGNVYAYKKGSVPAYPFKKGHKFPKEVEERRIKHVLAALYKKPSKLEKRFIDFFTRNTLPYLYVGNGKFIIGNKNPDFINTNGEKICVEVSNKRYKEQLDKRNFNSWKHYEDTRYKHFAEFGWKTVFLWDDESEEICLKKLAQSV